MNTEIHLTASLKATRRDWMALGVLALPTLLVSMDATVTYLALPTLSSSLKPTGSELLWITDMFTFMEGGFLIIMGALGDRVGRKRLLMIGFVAFSIASVMAAFSANAEMLIAARGFLGATGAIILPCTLSLIRSTFHDDKERTTAFGIYTTCYAGGTMLGPLLGGILLTHFWWGSVFLISVPLMFLFIFASGLMKEYRDPNAKQFSWWNAALLLTGMLSMVYGVKRIAESGNVEAFSLSGIIVGVLASAIFLYTQKTIRNPMINLKVFENSIFSTTLALLFVSLFCWSGLYLFVAQYLQLVLGLDPLKAGLLTLLPAALTMAGCMLAPQTLRWVKRSTTLIAGCVIMIGGALMTTQLDTATNLFLLIIACTGLSLGCGLIVTLGIDMVVSSAPPQEAGAASGISETSTTFGSAFGVALLGSVGMRVYHSGMLKYSSVGDEATHTLGGAMAVSQQLGAETGRELWEHAKFAFMQSFHTSSLIAAAVIFMAAAAFMWVLNGKT